MKKNKNVLNGWLVPMEIEYDDNLAIDNDPTFKVRRKCYETIGPAVFNVAGLGSVVFKKPHDIRYRKRNDKKIN